jgi:hypothetical protein
LLIGVMRTLVSEAISVRGQKVRSSEVGDWFGLFSCDGMGMNEEFKRTDTVSN